MGAMSLENGAAMSFVNRFSACLALTALAIAAWGGEPPASPPAGANPAINKSFQNPDFDEWTQRLEGESREIYRRRAEIVDASGAAPGMAVADVGAGTGLFTVLLARKVAPGGRVVAVDISQNFLGAIAKRATEEGLSNVSTQLGTQTDTRLPEASVDLVFTSDTYHHFEQVTPVLSSIRRALKPGGRFIVIDFDRTPGVASQRTLEHVRAGKETVIEEVRAAGFRLVREIGSLGLKQNYYLVFERT
jgi:ubiquinone/menaquinone biosynthesis C-methylase UbiE